MSVHALKIEVPKYTYAHCSLLRIFKIACQTQQSHDFKTEYHGNTNEYAFSSRVLYISFKNAYIETKIMLAHHLAHKNSISRKNSMNI